MQGSGDGGGTLSVGFVVCLQVCGMCLVVVPRAFVARVLDRVAGPFEQMLVVNVRSVGMVSVHEWYDWLHANRCDCSWVAHANSAQATPAQGERRGSSSIVPVTDHD